MSAGAAEQERVKAAVRVALDSLAAVQVRGDLLERRMMVAASFVGAFTQGVPEYSLSTSISEDGTLHVKGHRKDPEGDEGYLLTIDLVLPDRLRDQVAGPEE